MQWLNENALRASFASHELKAELMHYIRESYAHDEKRIIFVKQWQELSSQWQADTMETIDRNAQLARNHWKDRALKRMQRQRNNRRASLAEENDDDSIE